MFMLLRCVCRWAEAARHGVTASEVGTQITGFRRNRCPLPKWSGQVAQATGRENSLIADDQADKFPSGRILFVALWLSVRCHYQSPSCTLMQSERHFATAC